MNVVIIDEMSYKRCHIRVYAQFEVGQDRMSQMILIEKSVLFLRCFTDVTHEKVERKEKGDEGGVNLCD